METENQIIEVITNSGVEVTIANSLQKAFEPFFLQANEWAEKANKLVVTDISQVQEMKQAREARLALKEIRVSADKTRKSLKEDSVRYGKAVQGVYNVIDFLIVPIEKHLEQQEKFAEIQEAKIKDQLKEDREAELEPYREFVPFVDLREMGQEDYFKLLVGAKLQAKNKEEVELKAEADREAKEKADAIEQQRVAKEYTKLLAKVDADKKKADAEQKKREAEAKILAEAEQEKREALEAKVKIEQEANTKIQAELKAKDEAEKERLRLEQEAKEREKQETKQALLAPDKEKLVALAESLLQIKMPLVDSKEALKVLKSTQELLLKTANYIKQQSNQI